MWRTVSILIQKEQRIMFIGIATKVTALPVAHKRGSLLLPKLSVLIILSITQTMWMHRMREMRWQGIRRGTEPLMMY